MILSDKYCEGWCKENGGKGEFKDCTGCQIAELEAENQRYREALEAIADDVEEWEMKLVAMKSLEKIDND